jgi:hypothetical protein
VKSLQVRSIVPASPTATSNLQERADYKYVSIPIDGCF